MSEGSEVRVERQGPLAVWTIDRPDRLNALDRATVRELGRLCREAAEDRSLRAIIVTGSGDRAFCAGADLKERQGMTDEDVRDFLGLYRASFSAIDRLPVPTIAAINGVAFGGGLELALACDFRVMHRTAQIGLTETSLAIIPGAGGTQRLTRIVGEAQAKELILFAQRVGAARALSLGMVHRVTEGDESVLDCARAFVTPLLGAAPIAIASCLEAIDAAFEMSLESGLSVERRCYERTLGTADRREALEAFAQKRVAVFKGQ